MEYSEILHNSYESLRHNKYFDSLMILPPPFIVITVIFLPILIKYNDQRVNIALLKMQYILFAFFMFAFYNIITIAIIIPFSWLRILFGIIINNYTVNEYEVMNGYSRLVHFFIWILFGIPYLYFNHFTNDIIIFIKTCWDFTDNKDKLQDINFIDYRFIKTICRKFLHKEKKIVDIEEFVEKFSNLYDEVFLNTNDKKIKYSLKKQDCLNRQEILLEKIEATDFLQCYSVKGQVNVENVLILIENIKKMKKFKENGVMKKYPEYLQLANLGIINKAIDILLMDNK